MLLLSAVAVCIPVYAISNWNAAHMHTMIFIIALTLWLYESVAQTMAQATSNPIIGMVNFMVRTAGTLQCCVW
jgi:hypothetical protein